ncbi:DUF1697 domain-containing protein [Nocardioides coralli]|uniref:DUF1697 domain-containing protein n=1 Tax=Nocardioides coralli TaxID=2872154 RepID=UPI001CA466FA|nr:DUF1697 domain-containing protein [Nocardioides coralli]QZY28384.1 DUF1697 domain-containing protein [Nocardioides coralli]
MPRYVAFLRAINLGATRKFPMADVVAATEAAGGSDVATHLATGNVRLTSSLRSRARLEEALETAYVADRGFEVPTIVLTPAELRTVVADAEELGAHHAGRQFVSLLKTEPTEEGRRAIEQAGRDDERAVVRGRAVHLLLGESYLSSRLTNATIERHLGTATNRTLAVVRTVVEKWL